MGAHWSDGSCARRRICRRGPAHARAGPRSCWSDSDGVHGAVLVTHPAARSKCTPVAAWSWPTGGLRARRATPVRRAPRAGRSTGRWWCLAPPAMACGSDESAGGTVRRQPRLCRWRGAPSPSCAVRLTAPWAASRTSSTVASRASSACWPTVRVFATMANGYHDYVTALAGRHASRSAKWRPCSRANDTHSSVGMAWAMRAGRRCPSGRMLAVGTCARDARWPISAHASGIDAPGLERTVTQYNADARGGVDRAFGRGATAYNRFQGDARVGPQSKRCAAGASAVLRGKGHPGELRHVCGPRHRRKRARAPSRKEADRGPLCGRRRPRQRLRRLLSGGRDQSRSGDGIRLRRRASTL